MADRGPCEQDYYVSNDAVQHLGNDQVSDLKVITYLFQKAIDLARFCFELFLNQLEIFAHRELSNAKVGQVSTAVE